MGNDGKHVVRIFEVFVKQAADCFEIVVVLLVAEAGCTVAGDVEIHSVAGELHVRGQLHDLGRLHVLRRDTKGD
jgi:hypothetical protein